MQNARLTTSQVIAELKNLRMIEIKVFREIQRMLKHLTGRLDMVEFGFRNTALDETALNDFVRDAATFEWFKRRSPQIAESMRLGFEERTRPRLDEKSRKIQELEEVVRRATALLGGRRAAALLGTKLLTDGTHFTNGSAESEEV
ncbi:hypothetical protein HK104_007970, partial [Borealophlyctis nickersoniae]